MRALLTPSLAIAALTVATLAVAPPASADTLAPPANDDIADATQIAAFDTQADTTIGATREATDPANLAGPRTVWYTFTSTGGFPYEVATASESSDPGPTADFVVYRGTPGDLETVAVAHTQYPRVYNGHMVARFPTVKNENYYVGVVNRDDGTDFSLTLNLAKRPSSLDFLDMLVIGSGPIGQLHVERGHRPRVRIRVTTGFAGDSKPGRGPVSLYIEGGRAFHERLRDGRATFVLPKARRGFALTVKYPGSRRIDADTGHASMIVDQRHQR